MPISTFGGRDLDWVLYGPGGIVDSGRLVWIDDEDGDDPYYDALGFTLDPGHYRVVVTLDEESQVVVDADFDVVECVTVESGCHTVTFTNPAGNPAVLVRYSAAQTEDWPDQDPAEPREAIIQPGESRAVEIFWFEISWDAYAPADDPGDQWPNAGGHYSELPVQHCGPTMTRGEVGCAASPQGSVDASLSPPGDRGVRYRIVDDLGRPVHRAGPVGSDGRVHTDLPIGAYLFRSYTSDDTLPYDQAWFSVPPCVTAVQTCQGIKFANPSDHTVRVSYQREGVAEGASVRIGAGKAKTVEVASGTVSWSAAPYQTDDLWLVEPGHGSVRVDATCPSPSEGDQGTDDRDPLPNTGGPVTLWVVLAGLATAMTGLALLHRPRRRRS